MAKRIKVNKSKYIKKNDKIEASESEKEFQNIDAQKLNEDERKSMENDCKLTEDKSQTDTDIKVQKVTLTIAQKAQIELNRQKALLIRQEKLNKRKLYEINQEESKPNAPKIIRINDSKLVDTGGGFFIEEKSDELTKEDIEDSMYVVNDPPPLFKEDQPFCNDCSQPFDNSYLNHNFNELVCDGCRDKEDKHSLITKTDAKNLYLLNDTDFDVRPPPLKFILRKNPHNSQWGEMKLYLKLQIEKRALEVWGSEEALEEAIQKQEEKRQITKQRRYMKKMKELRMNVRSSLYSRVTKSHEHEYGEEVYHSDDDEYSKTCTTCGHSYKYDKM